ncbi:hypothetical protein [Xanthocytophaga agilis]|uniref:Nucleotide modification associated domain-containing protein n=1 Tax=Xanthocytophaga agilis TaxID=3048010 RepID=A0AAE3UDG1_9BACT|nr:hypothetical protein [Xanthocytophaga agilis]MDJ1500326.1 hypothetical protein [Xanthocytophaga agilis]
MKGYIYTMYAGADPGMGWNLTDPIFGKIPTLGACMPNIRRSVTTGDYIFSISGRVLNVKQYIVGGFEVDEKLDALTAYDKFPEYRMEKDEHGSLKGNIIIDQNGNHLDFDYHTNFETRINNYVVGKNPIFLDDKKSIDKAREETIDILNYLFNKKEDSVHKIIGRWRKIDTSQINDLISWFKEVRNRSNL